jgi:hypothetical protein
MLRDFVCALTRRPALRLALIALAVASLYFAWTPAPVEADLLTQGTGTRRAGQGTPTPEDEATPIATATQSGGAGTRRAGQGTPQPAAPTPTEEVDEPDPTPTRRAVAPTPRPTATPTVTPTLRPTATPTRRPTATPTEVPAGGVVLVVQANSNLRGGPGTNYTIVGHAAPGDQLIGIGRTADSSWVLLDIDAWIAAFLVVGDIADLPVVQVQVNNAPTPVPAANDAAAQRYIDDVNAYINVYVVALEGMNRLFNEAVANPSRFVETSWLQQMGTMLETIVLTNEQIRRLQPPASMVAVHNRLLAAASYMDRGAVAIANGIVSLNADLIIAGYGDFQLAAAELEAAGRLLP